MIARFSSSSVILSNSPGAPISLRSRSGGQSETSIFLIAATAADSRSAFFLSVRAVSFGFFDQRLAFLNDPLRLPWQRIAGSPLPLPRASHGDNERHTVTRSQFRLLRICTASGLNFHQLRMHDKFRA